jgi:dual 3',5'-cyclic-AMP and -GMP phosphodiesterase 11
MISSLVLINGDFSFDLQVLLQKLLKPKRDSLPGYDKDDFLTQPSIDEVLDTMAEAFVTIHESVGSECGHQAVIDATIAVAYKLLRVERVHVIMIKRDGDGKLMTLDSFQPEADHSRGIAAVAASTGRTVYVNDLKNDKRFLSFTGDRGIIYANVICSALKSSSGEVIGVITCFDKKHEGLISAFNRDDESLLESIAVNASVALKKSSLFEECSREKRRYAALIPVIRARSCSTPLDMVLKEIVYLVGQLLETDSVSIFLVDHENREAVICASSNGLAGYTVAFGQGTAGIAVAKGVAVRITNARRDIDFNSEVDDFCGMVTKTIMCVPVPGFKDKSAPAAIIQAINKRGGDNFDFFDEVSLLMICQELSNVLRSKAIELQELKSSTANSGRRCSTDIALLNSLLTEYGSKRYKMQSFSPSISRTSSYLLLPKSLSSSGSFRLPGLDTDAVDMMSEEEVDEYLACHDTDPFLLDDMALIFLAQHMLDAYGLVERFELNIGKLHQFFITVHQNYHKNNSFHNFKHAWGTMHLTYQILRKGADEYLTSLDILAVLIAAICHDLDHPGNNNAFEVATRSALAITYSDDVVLERHHCTMALKILFEPENDFTESLPLADKTRLRKVIISSIMATDMSIHFTLMAQLVTQSHQAVAFNKKESGDRILLTRFVLHSADIGAQTQSRELANKWTERCLNEFALQGEKEKALGLELTPFMQGLDDELTRMQLQVGFVGGIVVPLWSALAECFPQLEFAANQAISAKAHYSDEMTAISEKRSLSPA